MKPPEDTKVYEHLIATLWFDNSGILYSSSKASPRTKQIMIDYATYIKQITNNKKVCILSDISNARPLEKDARDYMETELKNIYLAMAIVSTSSLGKMIGNIFFKINKLSFPTKMFSNEEEALTWLKQFN